MGDPGVDAVATGAVWAARRPALKVFVGPLTGV